MGPQSSPLRIEVSSDIEAVRPQWETLESFGSPFQCRAWLQPWYRIVAPHYGAKPLFVTVRDAETERPLMFMPLCQRRRHGLRTIEFPDLEVSDYNTPLMAPEFDPSAAEFAALWDEIRRALPRADLVRFDKVPECLSGRENPVARLGWTNRLDLSAWLLELPATKADYDAGMLTKKARKETRRKRKHLCERVGELTLVDASTPEQGEELFAALRRERLARFGPGNLLERPCFREFYRAVIFDPWSPFATLSALKAGDRILATLFAIHQRRHYLLIMHSFAPELESLSPGIVAIDEMIGRHIEAGDEGIDFTVGNEGYKRQFGVSETFLVGGFYPMSVLGRLYLIALPHARRGRKALKRLIGRVRGAAATTAPAGAFRCDTS